RPRSSRFAIPRGALSSVPARARPSSSATPRPSSRVGTSTRSGACCEAAPPSRGDDPLPPAPTALRRVEPVPARAPGRAPTPGIARRGRRRALDPRLPPPRLPRRRRAAAQAPPDRVPRRPPGRRPDRPLPRPRRRLRRADRRDQPGARPRDHRAVALQPRGAPRARARAARADDRPERRRSGVLLPRTRSLARPPRPPDRDELVGQPGQGRRDAAPARTRARSGPVPADLRRPRAGRAAGRERRPAGRLAGARRAPPRPRRLPCAEPPRSVLERADRGAPVRPASRVRPERRPPRARRRGRSRLRRRRGDPRPPRPARRRARGAADEDLGRFARGGRRSLSRRARARMRKALGRVRRRAEAAAGAVRDRRRHRAIAGAAATRPGIAVFYGHDRLPGPDEPAHGGTIKFQQLASAFPNEPRRFNLLYFGSSVRPSDSATLLRLARERAAPIVINQNGVAYPGWHGPGWERTNKPLAELL